MVLATNATNKIITQLIVRRKNLNLTSIELIKLLGFSSGISNYNLRWNKKSDCGGTLRSSRRVLAFELGPSDLEKVKISTVNLEKLIKNFRYTRFIVHVIIEHKTRFIVLQEVFCFIVA